MDLAQYKDKLSAIWPSWRFQLSSSQSYNHWRRRHGKHYRSLLAEKIKQLRDHGAVMSDLQRHLGPKPYLLADHIHAGYNHL